MLARIYDDMLEEIKHLSREQQGLVILAFVNYEVYWIEPPVEDTLTYSLRKSKKITLDKIISDIRASRDNWNKGWRPKKSFENCDISQKPKHNLSITQAKPKINSPVDNSDISQKPKHNLNETWYIYNNIYNNNIYNNNISSKSLENRVIGEGEKKKKTPTPTLSLVQEYLEAYETSPLKELVWNDEGAIKEWLVYKQNKKEMYASPKTFLQTLKWYINLVNPNWVRLPDIWSRLAFAIHLAIDNKRKWLFREEKQKQLYEGSKKIDLVINRKQWEI